MFHNGERSCKKKKTIFWAVFHRESNNFWRGSGGRCEGLCSLSGQMRPCAIVAGPGQGPRDPGPIVALACQPPRTTCSKSKNSGVGIGAGRQGDAAVTGQFPCVRVLPLDRLPLSLPLSLQADVRDHVAKANSCKRGLDMVPRKLDYGLVIVQSTDRNRSNLCNRRPPCRASLLSHPSMPK